MAVLNVQAPSRTGGAFPVLGAAAGGGDSFANNGSTYFIVNNASGGPIDVTFDSPNACNFGVTGAVHDLVVEDIPTGERWEIGPFDQSRFNDPTTQRVGVSYSGVTGVAVAAVRR